MRTAQTQITLSLPDEVVGLLRTKADRLGVSVKQLAKKVLVREVQEEQYPTFKASKATMRAAKQAMKDYQAGKAVIVDDVHEFFKNL